MTTLKTPSRRRLVAAATVGLAPISLALWLTYPSAKAEAGSKSTQSDVRSEQTSEGAKNVQNPSALQASSGS